MNRVEEPAPEENFNAIIQVAHLRWNSVSSCISLGFGLKKARRWKPRERNVMSLSAAQLFLLPRLLSTLFLCSKSLLLHGNAITNTFLCNLLWDQCNVLMQFGESLLGKLSSITLQRTETSHSVDQALRLQHKSLSSAEEQVSHFNLATARRALSSTAPGQSHASEFRRSLKSKSVTKWINQFGWNELRNLSWN